MKNKNFGFTLIELLVVIVIIGILATISTATFSGYFKKSRDTERQSFVRNAQQILVASQISGDTANTDYRLGGTTNDANATTGIVTKVKAELAKQGYAVPEAKNGIKYYMILNQAVGTRSDNFLVFACQEDALPSSTGNNTGTIDTFAFSAGTSSTLLTDAQAQAACANPVAAPSPTAPAIAVDLNA